MGARTRWENRHFHCPEENREANLLLEYSVTDDEKTLRSISCDNPKLRDLDYWDWDCRWTCWGQMERK